MLQIGLHGRFDKVRIPRENILNAVADVTADGVYRSAIKDPDQVSMLLILPYGSCSFDAKLKQEHEHEMKK